MARKRFTTSTGGEPFQTRSHSTVKTNGRFGVLLAQCMTFFLPFLFRFRLCVRVNRVRWHFGGCLPLIAVSNECAGGHAIVCIRRHFIFSSAIPFTIGRCCDIHSFVFPFCHAVHLAVFNEYALLACQINRNTFDTFSMNGITERVKEY